MADFRCFRAWMVGLMALGVVGEVRAVAVEAAWARPSPPGARVGAVYLTLVGGKTADRLLSARSAAAAAVELHTHQHHDGVARMRPVAAIELPAHGRVALEPGGLHLMLIELKAPLSVGATVPLTLRFETAGEVSTHATVSSSPPAASGDGHGHRY